jgi:hypothetical protein
MSSPTKIQPPHQARQAVVYVRQSTTKQLVANQESTRRQYQLADRAHALGWPRPRIAVIDEDLGLSGASSQQRVGFQRLVTALSLGTVGAIFVTEVSRLSRLNSDWHRVIELCAVFDTLIADEDGVYDPADPNDRLVLGLNRLASHCTSSSTSRLVSPVEQRPRRRVRGLGRGDGHAPSRSGGRDSRHAGS